MNPNSLANLSLDGKVAVVTGSTQGLGEAIATLFVERGVSGIVITGRNKERGAKVKKDLEAKGAKAVFVEAEPSWSGQRVTCSFHRATPMRGTAASATQRQT